MIIQYYFLILIYIPEASNLMLPLVSWTTMDANFKSILVQSLLCISCNTSWMPPCVHELSIYFVCYVAFVVICLWSVLLFPPFLRFGHSARMAAARAATPGRHPGHTARRRDQGLPNAGAGPGGGVPIHRPGGRWVRTAFPIRRLYLLPGLYALLACFATTSCQQSWQPGRAAQRKWRDPWSGARPNGGWRGRGLIWWGTLITSLTLRTGLGGWDQKDLYKTDRSPSGVPISPSCIVPVRVCRMSWFSPHTHCTPTTTSIL